MRRLLISSRLRDLRAVLLAGICAVAYDRSRTVSRCEPRPNTSPQITSSRLMSVGDTNLAGNVHGGTILDMIESAGYIAACRHVKPNTQKNEFVALARLERVDFLLPMHVGELSQLKARVVGGGPHSVEVVVDVFAENLQTGDVKRTNQARLWYVYLDTSRDKFKPLKVPKLDLTPLEEAAARDRYQDQKNRRSQHPPITRVEWDKQEKSYPSAVHLSLMLNSVDGIAANSSLSSLVRGGPIMKLIDTAAGMVAFQHCRTNIVTASINTLDLITPIKLTDVVHISARPTFASSRSLEVEVIVEAEDLRSGTKHLSTRGLLTFVSLNRWGKPISLPPLIPATDGQRDIFKTGELRYLERKRILTEERRAQSP